MIIKCKCDVCNKLYSITLTAKGYLDFERGTLRRISSNPRICTKCKSLTVNKTTADAV